MTAIACKLSLAPMEQFALRHLASNHLVGPAAEVATHKQLSEETLVEASSRLKVLSALAAATEADDVPIPADDIPSIAALMRRCIEECNSTFAEREEVHAREVAERERLQKAKDHEAVAALDDALRLEEQAMLEEMAHAGVCARVLAELGEAYR